MATYRLQPQIDGSVNLHEVELDKVSQYQNGRYISSHEAVWRILSFPIHERHPAIVQLTVHLENEQSIYYRPQQAAEIVQRAPKHTTLTGFFHLCANDSFAETIFYHQAPTSYTWDKSLAKWCRRKMGKQVEGVPGVKSHQTLGRVYCAHPSAEERFFLRMLLHEVKGPCSFEELRKVGGSVCATYREACNY